MTQSLPTVNDLPTILKVLQDYPFGALVLAAGYLVVKGISAWRGGEKPPAQGKP